MESEQIREQLEQEQSRLLGIRTDLRDAESLDEPQSNAYSELSVVDQHPADVATEQSQREIDLSTLEQVEAELDDVERALRKLDDGTYGRCEACGAEIDEARLEALPATRFCLNDQSLAESEMHDRAGQTQQAETTAFGEATPL